MAGRKRTIGKVAKKNEAPAGARLTNNENVVFNEICGIFKTIFLAKTREVEGMMNEITDKLRKIYDDLPTKGVSKSFFLKALNYRFNKLFNTLGGRPNLARVIKIVVVFAVNLSGTMYGTDKEQRNGNSCVVEYLAKYIRKWAHCIEENRRANICLLIGTLFEYFCAKGVGVVHLHFFEFAYTFLVSSLLEENEYNRLEAIKAISKIQQITFPPNSKYATPTKALLEKFYDRSEICRLTVIKTFKDPSLAIPELRQRMFNEKSQTVRMAAVSVFSSCLQQNADADMAIYFDTISRLLKDENDNVRSAARNEILKKWILHFCDVASRVKQEKDIKNEDDGVDNKTNDPSDNTSHKNIKLGVITMLRAFFGIVSSETLDRFCFFSQETLEIAQQIFAADGNIAKFSDELIATADDGNIDILHRGNLSHVFVHNDDAVNDHHKLKTIVIRVIIWQNILEYIHNKKDMSEEDRSQTMDKFLPKMSTMIEILKQNALKDVLMNLIVNIYYEKRIIDLIVSKLIVFYDEPNDFLELVFEDLEKTIGKPRETIRKRVCFIGKTHSEKGNIDEKYSVFEVQRLVIKHKLHILNAALKSENFKELHPVMLQQFHELITQGLEFRDTENHVAAMEIVGNVVLFDFEAAAPHLKTIFKGFPRAEVQPNSIDSPELRTLLTMVMNWCIVHGYERVHEVINELNVIEGGKWYLHTIIQIILLDQDEKSRDSRLALKAVECATQLLIHIPLVKRPYGPGLFPKYPAHESLVLTLLGRLTFELDTEIGAEIRKWSKTALYLFAQQSVNNQMVIFNTYRPYLERFATSDPALVKERLERSNKMYVMLMRKSTLNEEETTEKSPHYHLAMKVCEWLLDDDKRGMYIWYFDMLSRLEYDAMNKLELDDIYSCIYSRTGKCQGVPTQYDGILERIEAVRHIRVSSKKSTSIHTDVVKEEAEEIKQEHIEEPSSSSSASTVKVDKKVKRGAQRSGLSPPNKK